MHLAGLQRTEELMDSPPPLKGERAKGDGALRQHEFCVRKTENHSLAQPLPCSGKVSKLLQLLAPQLPCKFKINQNCSIDDCENMNYVSNNDGDNVIVNTLYIQGGANVGLEL